MSDLIASNALLLDRATSLRTRLNTGVTARLFTGPTAISPANVLADFSEANYGGYVGQSLAGLFGTPAKIQDGEYQINAVPLTFGCTGTPDNTVRGLYLDDGTDVLFSALFDSPISFTNGVSITLVISPQDWALAIL